MLLVDLPCFEIVFVPLNRTVHSQVVVTIKDILKCAPKTQALRATEESFPVPAHEAGGKRDPRAFVWKKQPTQHNASLFWLFFTCNGSFGFSKGIR
ncbi:hypothetical protein PUV44_18895 [Xanthomonas arboricola pv. corylina]|nr:hypothetical protein PUV44_18895 [Xanthomonas arboricola pv. corylina]